MKRTKSQPKPTTPGFAIQLTETTDLGIGMLIAEDAGGHYLPVAPVSTIGEAKEIAQHDLHHRLHEKERGEAVSPAVYKVWAHGLHGYVVAAKFDPSTL